MKSVKGLLPGPPNPLLFFVAVFFAFFTCSPNLPVAKPISSNRAFPPLGVANVNASPTSSLYFVGVALLLVIAFNGGVCNESESTVSANASATRFAFVGEPMTGLVAKGVVAVVFWGFLFDLGAR